MKHNESPAKPWWYPRHPGVVALDITGVMSTLYWIMQSQHSTSTVYLVIVGLLYTVSAIYHHARERIWLGKLDHIMIFYVIAFTALPYWGYVMPFSWHPLGLILILGICVVGTIIKLLSFLPRWVSGLVYIGASTPMVTYFVWFIDSVPSPYQMLWLSGVLLYGLQLIIYTGQYCDWRPAQWGYREQQHVVLLSATNLHSFIAVNITAP
jgi:channel protein (hemolysin III family)